MHDIFYPTSVAVIGVSAKLDNLGRNIVANLVEFGFTGAVYAVGPSGGTIETRRIYRTVGEIPDPVDLAVILTPAQTVPGVLAACGEKGIRRAVIETAGFREFTDAGRAVEEEITRIAAQYGIRFVGPNGIGVVNMENGLCLPFPRMKKKLKRGKVSVVSQSGGVGMAVFNLMINEGVGLNKFVSAGNMLNVDAEDLLEYLITDEGTGLIFLYLESLRDGRRLMDIARRSSKPIVIFKSNIGTLSRSIALSHTASLSSDDKVVDAAFRQAGILRVRDATALSNGLKILELPPMRGRNLAVISRSGGHAVMAADACELNGFNLAPFPESFLREIEKHFRASVIRLTNPLDLGDLFDLNLYAQIVERTLQLEGVDGIVFLHTATSDAENLAARELLERLSRMAVTYDKPVAYYLSAAAEEVNYLKQHYNFPVFTQVVETVRALDMSYTYCKREGPALASDPIPAFDVDRAAVRALVDRARAESRSLLLSEALEVLEHYGIPTTRGVAATGLADAQAAAAAMGYPVVLKVIAEEISHKSDAGGVQLNLRDAADVATAYAEIMASVRKAYPDVVPDGVLVQPMIAGGTEMILGGRQDPQFGPVVLVGLGGIFVEIYGDVAVRVAPITRPAAAQMVASLRGARLLTGARGRAPADVDALVDALLRVAQLLVDFPEIAELDVNPLRVFDAGAGCRALDARVILTDR